MVVSVTAVRGSTYPSTPTRLATNCSRWLRSPLCEPRSRVPRRLPPDPPRPPPRSRSNRPMARLPWSSPGVGVGAVIIATLGEATVLPAASFPEWQDEGKAPPARAGRRRLHRGELRECTHLPCRPGHPRWWLRWLKRGVPRRRARPQRRPHREGQGRRHLTAPRLHPDQGAAARR